MKKKLILSFVVFLLAAIPGFSSHFRAGSVTWTRISETSSTVTIRLNVSLSWRLGVADPSAFFTITGGNSGSINVPLTNTADPSGGWTNSFGTANVTLNKTSVITTLTYSGCCKISTLSNNPDRPWNVFTKINTAAPGSSPVSTMPAIINMPIGAAAATFSIPASDPDPGSTLSFRLATPTEMGGGSNPAGLLLSNTGLLTFNTIGKSIGQQFNAMAVVTDNNGNQLVLDFMINMTGPSNPPVFDYMVTPTNGQVYNVIAGQNISFDAKASDSDAGSTVSFSVSGLPSYITLANFTNNPLPATGNPAQTTFDWTPLTSHIGNTVILNLIATDNVGVQASSSVTIRVVAEPAPEFIAPTPGEGTIRQIQTGILHQDIIKAESSLGSDVSIGFATGIPSGAIITPSLPTTGANPGQIQFDWTPAPSDFGQKDISFQSWITSTPTIFSTRAYSLIVNTPPEFSSDPPLSINDGDLYSYDITVNDPDIPFSDVVDIIASTLPSWLTLTPTGNGTASLHGTPAFSDGGIHQVVLEAEDIYHHGNPEHTVQSFEINVITCTTPVIDVIDDISTNADDNVCGASINFSAEVSGMPDPDVSYQVSGENITFPHTFPVGETTVTVSASNTCGTVTSTFTVTVADTQPPTIIDMVPDLYLSACESEASWDEPGVSDNCHGATITRTGIGPGSTVDYGSATTVTYTAVDAAGNQTTASFTITRASELTAASTATTILCNGGTSTVAVTASGGKSPYSGTGDFEVTAGNRSFTITDADGCTVETTISISEPPALTATIQTSNTFLFFGSPGNQTATITAWPSGGTPPYAVSITMVGNDEMNYPRVLLCDVVTDSGDETWASGSNTSSTVNACGVKPVSTSNSTVMPGDNYSVTAGLIMDARFIATITDANGCVYTIPYEEGARVDAEDVRCFSGSNTNNQKVQICHQTGNSKKPCVSICVDESAVADHLAHGDYYGTCSPDCSAPVANARIAGETIDLESIGIATTYPNPFRSSLTILVSNPSKEEVSMRMMDLTGRDMLIKTPTPSADGVYELNTGNVHPGIYLLRVNVGPLTKVLKVLKEE